MIRQLRNLVLGITLLAATVPAFFCNTPDVNTPVAPESAWKNVYYSNAHYVGMQTCRGCHEPIYETFMQTGMGKSFGLATKEKSAADFAPAHALVYDSALDYYYKPYWDNDSFCILEYRIENGDTVHKLVQRVNYIVGSGQHTNSHIYSISGYLYQAPITFYTQKHRWDLAPGFEKGASTRFQRMIEIECMSCHNGYPDFETGSQNKYRVVKTGLDCERCHGPGSLHVAARQTSTPVDTSQTPDYTIVNPRRLSTELQNNVCQRCHLQGIAVLNDGKTFLDFRPGMKLSEVVNVFMPEYEGARDKMIMASHVERMKKSQCFIQSGKMSCITCHNPHVSVQFTPRSQFINACQGCHGAGHECTESLQVRAARKNDCITCHMPHNGSIDIPHVAVTDHFIRKRPADDSLQSKITAFLGLKCFNNDHPDAITTARGYMEFFERYAEQSKGLLDSVFHYLDQQSGEESKLKQNRDYIRACFLLKDYRREVTYAAGLTPASINDAWTAYRLGEAYFQLQLPDSALPWYRRATEIWNYSLDFQNKYGICLLAMGRIPEAMQVFQFVLGQNPNHISANTNLGYIYIQMGKNELAKYYLERCRQLDPDYEQNLVNLAVWYHNNQQPEQARDALLHLLRKHPTNERAKAMLIDLQR